MSDANVLPIFRNSKARREGYLAGRRGSTGADNPYKGETREACAWLTGMLDGRGLQLTVAAVRACQEPDYQPSAEQRARVDRRR